MNPPHSATATRWVVVLTAIGSFMAALDTLVVATALNTIQRDFGATVEQLEWTVNAYNLSFAVLLITAAALGDRFGRRNLYAAGMAIFTIASIASALAPNVGALIAARALQGAGSALLMPLGLALLSAAFPPEKRGAAIGLFSAITGLAVASGPLVGGLVVDGLAWEWIFWINVPIGLVTIPLVLTKMRESFGPRATIDLLGVALVTGGAVGLVWGLVRGNSAGWDSFEVNGTLIAGALLVVAFIAWELRAPAPMLPLRFFRSRAFAAGNATIFANTAALYTGIFFYAQLLQVMRGYGPLDAGLRLVPWTATFLVIAPIAGTVADRIGERIPIVTGLTLQAIGMAWLALIAEPGLDYSRMLAPFVVAGVGASMAIPAAQKVVVGSVERESIGKAAGVNSMMRQLGGVFGIAITVAVFAATGGHSTARAFADGFTPAILVGAGIALVGAFAGLALPGRKPASPTPAPVPSARAMEEVVG